MRAAAQLFRGGSELFPRRRLAVLFGLLLVLSSLGSVWALDQIAKPAGAPEPKNGPFRPPGFVRVVDGDTFEVLIDGRRTGVGILGVDAPALGTPCGDAARAELQSLVGRGVILEDDPANKIDRRRRMYRVSTPDGRSIAATLVTAGLARATGRGPEASALAVAEAKARQETAGCVWGGKVPPARASAGSGFVAQAAAQVPASFLDDVVASGLNFPTGFAFLPDGRILVAEKEGIVRLVTSNGLQSTPVLDISSRVNNFWDRGLIGITVDPDVASNGRFYLFYVYESTPTDDDGPKSSQIARFTLRSDGTADPNAGVVILGKEPGAGCPSTPADCLPADDWSHSGGGLRFLPDGSLLVSTGDAASFTFVDELALRAQSLDSLAGKILRVTTDGKGLNSNPYWTGNADHAQSKIWARGFRNPFRINVRPSGPSAGALFVGDVGWGGPEEIDLVPSGTNAGWPCYEGSPVQEGYAGYPVCQALINQTNPALRAKAPLIEWPHPTDRGGAALMGAFYSGTEFPPGYFGALFYADYAEGWIKSVRLLDNNQVDPAGPSTFAQGIAGPVQIETGPDGALWYLAIGSGELHRIRYVANYTPIQCPDGQFRAEYFNNQTLLGVPNVSRCENSIDYDWGLGTPVSGIQADRFSVRWTGRFTFGNDTYNFTTTSDDGIRVFVDGQTVIDDWQPGAANTVTGSKMMTAGQHTVVVEYFEDTWPAVVRASWASQTPNQPPTPTISAPAAGTKFKVGDVIQFQGSAGDPQGPIPSSGLRWDVILKHCPGFGPTCHDHPFVTLTGASAQFTAPDHGDGTSLEIELTATDSFGLTGVTSRQLEPKTVQVTLAASPLVGTVKFDGLSHPPPYTTTTIAGSSHPIGAEGTATLPFTGWVHGGPQNQTVTVGEQNVTYTARMGSACIPRPRVIISNVPAGTDARLITVSTSTNPGYPTNTLKSIAFTETRAATIEAPGTTATRAPYSITYPSGTTQATFTARRSQAGKIFVSFTMTDDCGTWDSFVGSGSTSGF